MGTREDNEVCKQAMRKLASEGRFCVLKRERQMDHLEDHLGRHIGDRKGLHILDACCGQGRLIHFLSKFAPEQNFLGVDIVEDFIDEGRERFRGVKNVRFERGNIFDLSDTYGKDFDICINYKTLSWLPSYEEPVRQMINVTRERIYITSLFFEGDVDFSVRVHENQMGRDVYTYLNTYSMPRFTEYCIGLGARNVEFHDMKLDLDLPESEDPDVLDTFTRRLDDGQRLEITGVVLLNWKLVVIEV
ncbi:MAG: methyltransferase domain-containing protein [Thermodesulfovibrionales bacterium]|nr:methyltransferase domain-containing protein [Thermodesulfovibrionales bacterium]